LDFCVKFATIMGSYLSYYNNTDRDVEIWGELKGGGCPASGYQTKTLKPGEYYRMGYSLSLVHDVVVKYFPHDKTEPTCVYRERWAPPHHNQRWHRTITDLLGYDPSLNFKNPDGVWVNVWSQDHVLAPTTYTVSWEASTTTGTSHQVTHKLGVKLQAEYQASAQACLPGCKSNGQLSYQLAVMTMESDSFTKKETHSMTVTMKPGDKVAVWQYVLRCQCLDKTSETKLNRIRQTRGAPPCDPQVFLKSHHNTQLQDNNGNLQQTGNTGAWELWTLGWHGDNRYVFRSHRDFNLSSKNGAALEANLSQDEIFYLLDAGNGRVYIRNKLAKQLSAGANGALTWSPNKQAWEEWSVVPVSGMPLDLVLGTPN